MIGGVRTYRHRVRMPADDHLSHPVAVAPRGSITWMALHCIETTGNNNIVLGFGQCDPEVARADGLDPKVCYAFVTEMIEIASGEVWTPGHSNIFFATGGNPSQRCYGWPYVLEDGRYIFLKLYSEQEMVADISFTIHTARPQ